MFSVKKLAAGMLVAVLAAGAFGGLGRADDRLPAGVTPVGTAEADGVNGGGCIDLKYADLTVGGFGFFGCGGSANKNGTTVNCPKTAIVIFAYGLGSSGTSCSDDCLECGAKCGTRDVITPCAYAVATN